MTASTTPRNSLRIVTTNVPSRERKKPGPKPKSIRDRLLDMAAVKPIRRVERSYSRETKIKILKFHLLYKIPVEGRNNQYRTPTLAETSSMFLVPESTVNHWVKKEDQIIKQAYGSFAGSPLSYICAWPEMEEKLYSLFLTRRSEGKLVRRGWFRCQARRVFAESYPNAQLNVFVFSVGWFNGFLNRHHISLRFTTNKAQKIPDDFRKLIINWLRFNRRVSQLDTGHLLLSNIANLDETPIPFEFLDGRTYDTKGLRTIWAKSSKNGWDKRQASLVLMVFADGIPRVKPKLIFHGTTGEQILKKEQHLYDSRVTVEFNKTAYNNETLFIKQIEKEIVPAFEGRPSLFVVDAAAFHKSRDVLDIFRKYSIIPSMIPAGCTSLVQPLDVSINAPFKDLLRECIEEYIENEEDKGKVSWSVGDKWVMITICVGRIWDRFCMEKRNIIQELFCNVGLALPVDGSRDDEINIKGFIPEELAIRDWRIPHEFVMVEHGVVEEVDDDSLTVDYH